MTSQFDFSNDGWTLVVSTPLLVGMAVARAEDSGIFGSLRETRTLLAEINSATSDNPATSLIAQVAATDHDANYEAYKSMSAEALATDAVLACEGLARLLDQVAEPAEGHGYKQWIIAIAHHVAEAAKEKGVRVSEGEQKVIEQITAALITPQGS